MSDIVFILGAGASRDCGAPLMHDFLDTAHTLLRTGLVEESKREDFERVLRAISSLQKIHSKSQFDLNNIESIFTALEISNVLGKLPDFEREEIPAVIASLKEVIVETLEKTIAFPMQGRSITPTKSYDSFSKLIKHLKNETRLKLSSSVITFNYDIALDMAMYKNEQGPVYGIGSEFRSAFPTKLLKLHGSLNWAVNKEDNTVQPLTLHEYFQAGYSYNGLNEIKGCFVPIGSQLQQYYSKHSSMEVESEPVIIPPTWNKADYHHLISKTWGLAANELEEAEHVFIIGYSLPETDAFFKLLYGIGSAGNTPLKNFIVYNPDQSGEVENRFRNMLGPGALARFKFKSLDFSNCIKDIRSLFSEGR